MHWLFVTAIVVWFVPDTSSAQTCDDDELDSIIESEPATLEIGCAGANSVLPKTVPPTAAELEAFCQAGKDAILKPCADAVKAAKALPGKLLVDKLLESKCEKKYAEQYGPFMPNPAWTQVEQAQQLALYEQNKAAFIASKLPTCKKLAWIKFTNKLMAPCSALAGSWYQDCAEDPTAMIQKCMPKSTPTPTPIPTPTPTPTPIPTPMPQLSPSPLPTPATSGSQFPVWTPTPAQGVL